MLFTQPLAVKSVLEPPRTVNKEGHWECAVRLGELSTLTLCEASCGGQFAKDHLSECESVV